MESGTSTETSPARHNRGTRDGVGLPARVSRGDEDGGPEALELESNIVRGED
jgi:hypothetical protein